MKPSDIDCKVFNRAVTSPSLFQIHFAFKVHAKVHILIKKNENPGYHILDMIVKTKYILYKNIYLLMCLKAT